MEMEVIQNEVVSKKTIVLDDKHFVAGKYSECTLVFSGGEFQATNTAFERCSMVFSGAAQRTINFLVGIGALPAGDMKFPGNPKGGNPAGGKVQ